MAQRVPLDPDKGVDDLVRELADDSKRLLSGEIRLAKLEAADSMRRAARGTMWMALAFGVAVVALVACTLFVATLVGRLARGHYWLGAVVVGIVEVIAGAWLFRKGIAAFSNASYSLPDTRAGLRVIRNAQPSGGSGVSFDASA